MPQDKQKQQKPIAILGAGSWGTALALYLSRRGQSVRLWSIERSEIEAMLAEKANNRYLPDIVLPDFIKPTINLADAIKDVRDVVIAVPSVGYKETLKLMKPLLHPATTLISATKGLDAETGELPNEMVETVLGQDYPFAVLSGPSFAREVAIGLPCAIVIASGHKKLVNALMQRFNSAIFHVYPSNDVIGVEIGGVGKNVIAIATGLVDGMKLGANARSALITFGLEEISRLGIALGGKAETFGGLSGLGDLILTCMDDQSRNRRLGLFVGQGKNVEEAEREIGQAVEGKRNAELILKLAQRHHVRMPICETMWQLLQGKLTAQAAIEQLFSS